MTRLQFVLFVSCILAFCSTLNADQTRLRLNTNQAQAGSQDAAMNTVEQKDLVLRIAQLNLGDTLTLDNTTIGTIDLTVQSSERSEDGILQVVLSSSQGMEMLLSIYEQTLYGSLTGNDINYVLESTNPSSLKFIDQTHASLPDIDFGNDGLIPPTMDPNRVGSQQLSETQQQKLRQSTERANKSGRSIIRIMVLYSPEFAQGFSSPAARINQLLNFTNSSMQRSGIDIEFVLAHRQQINFNNAQSVSTTLDQVTQSQGAFAGVPALRNQHAADLVSVLSFRSGSSANGIAWVNGSDPDFGFSSVRLSPGCCDSVFTHELGHNMGSGHERSSVNPVSNPCSTFRFTSYACGHGNVSNDWGTVMARINSRRINHLFSNPNLSCEGEPCGIAAGQTGAADNVASINLSRILVADFRGDPSGSSSPPSSPPAANQNSRVITPVFDLLLNED